MICKSLVNFCWSLILNFHMRSRLREHTFFCNLPEWNKIHFSFRWWKMLVTGYDSNSYFYNSKTKCVPIVFCIWIYSSQQTLEVIQWSCVIDILERKVSVNDSFRSFFKDAPVLNLLRHDESYSLFLKRY